MHGKAVAINNVSETKHVAAKLVLSFDIEPTFNIVCGQCMADGKVRQEPPPFAVLRRPIGNPPADPAQTGVVPDGHAPTWEVAWAGLVGYFQLLSSKRALLLVLVLAAAMPGRLLHLDAQGFAEDEVDKLRAAAAYRRGDFTADPEHPMLMKLAIVGSFQVTDAWNSFEPPAPLMVSDETALRLPNAVAGALAAVVLFLLAELLFDRSIAIWAGFLWALDVNAIAVNRIGKEDSFLVLFLLIAAWYYERGKRVGQTDPKAAQRWFTRCGAAFGLMTAAKYMPYFYGLHVIFFRAAAPHQGLNRPDKRPFFLAMLAAFLLANFALLTPANWRAITIYVTEQTMTHTGYVFAGQIYMNKISATPWGVPPWFYVTYLLTKVPLATLLAFGLGLVQVVVRRQERGYVFARVFLVFTLIPYSLAASKFVRYMLPMFVVVDLIAAIGIAWLVRRVHQAPRSAARSWAGALATVVFMLSPIAATLSARPHYGLYQNPIGASASRQRLLFPHDELYDAGVREAAAFVAARAGRGAVVLSETPAVARVYLDRFARSDVETSALSSGSLPGPRSEVWFLVQDGRVYFENAAMIDNLRRRHSPVTEIRVFGHRAVQVFRGR